MEYVDDLMKRMRSLEGRMVHIEGRMNRLGDQVSSLITLYLKAEAEKGDPPTRSLPPSSENPLVR
jgi:hypothetical protein